MEICHWSWTSFSFCMQFACDFSRYLPDEGLCPQAKPFPVWNQPKIKGTGSRLCAWSLIKLLFSNLLLIVLVNNPTHMYLNNLRVYFKVEVYFRVTRSDSGVLKLQKKLVDYANTTNVEFVVDPKVLFHGWLIYSYLQIFKLIKSKWLPGECAVWFFDNIMTWSYCLHRQYSMSRQENSILINEHALNREPVPLKW